jgi:NADH-quinone oxidoreductase subunit N
MNAIIFSALWGVILMLAGVFIKNKTSIRYLAIIGAALLILADVFELYHPETPIFHIDARNMLSFNVFGLEMNAIAFISTLLYFLLSSKDIEKVGSNVAEYFALIFFVLCGVAIVTSYSNLLMLFLGIEILSIPLFILTGSSKKNLKSNEASLKYFLMGAFSTGILLLGIAFLYGASKNGSFLIEDIGAGKNTPSPLMITGLLLLAFSLSFKVSAAPFHFWTPDVYDGSPTVFTSFMATVVKGAAFVAFIRIFSNAFGDLQSKWELIIAIITASTLIIGNVTAVFQQSVKRMLAYSSIAQVGFMLFSILGLKFINTAQEGIALYITAYSLATVGLFAVLTKMNDHSLEGFNGLAKKQPLIAATSTVFLLSLAGIPLTAGFFAKYYMISAVMQLGKFYWLIILSLVCAAISVYYYFRIIQAMYFKEGAGTEVQFSELSPTFEALLVLVSAAIIVLGIKPDLLTNWLNLIYF